MSASKVSAVLFVKNLEQLSEFYRKTLALSVTNQDSDHTILSTAGFDLVVHRIPDHIAKHIEIAQPPQRRAAAAIKLSFPVADIARVRSLAASFGGRLDPHDREWSDGQAIVCKGHDPEGYIFQVCQAASGE